MLLQYQGSRKYRSLVPCREVVLLYIFFPLLQVAKCTVALEVNALVILSI